VFFFFNFENINQVNTITFQPDLTSLQPLAANYGSPATLSLPEPPFRLADKR
jgi:hypothetical protein